jgi:hypothetical protein
VLLFSVLLDPTLSPADVIADSAADCVIPVTVGVVTISGLGVGGVLEPPSPQAVKNIKNIVTVINPAFFSCFIALLQFLYQFIANKKQWLIIT